MMSRPIFIAGSTIRMAPASCKILNPGMLACVAPTLGNVGAMRLDSMMVTVVSVGVTENGARNPEPSMAITTSFEAISKSIDVFVGELILNEMLVYLPVRSVQPIIPGLDAIK